MEHDPDTRLPVYHTPDESSEPVEREAAAWVRFGLDVMTAHQPESGSDICRGCGRIWDCCPVVVAARQHGLNEHLNAARTRTQGTPAQRQ